MTNVPTQTQVFVKQLILLIQPGQSKLSRLTRGRGQVEHGGVAFVHFVYSGSTVDQYPSNADVTCRVADVEDLL